MKKIFPEYVERMGYKKHLQNCGRENLNRPRGEFTYSLQQIGVTEIWLFDKYGLSVTCVQVSQNKKQWRANFKMEMKLWVP